MLEIAATGRTHVGKIRTKNEDSFCIDTELGLFLVADGMGGHASGEVASRMAIEVVKETYEKSYKDKNATLLGKRDPRLSRVANRIVSSIRFANRAVFELSQKEYANIGMGTTLVGLLAQRDKIIQLHVGDSRIYRIRGGEALQLTEDHSLVTEQLKLGLLTEEEVKFAPAKNVITRAIGINKEVAVDIQHHAWVEGDTYLLCTDGFSDLIDTHEIPEIVERHNYDLDASNEAFIEAALDRGGQDNITVVLIRLGRKMSRTRRLKEKLQEWLS
jgi:protein phosphatase